MFVSSKYRLDFGRVALGDLVSPDFNPRRISVRDFDALKRNIRKFGYQDLIIVNKRNNHIVAGNQRYRALKDLNVELHGKYRVIDVIFVDLDLCDEKAFNISHNRIGGEFDEVKLEALLDELEAEDYSMDLSGFVDCVDNLDLEDLDVDDDVDVGVVEDLGSGGVVGREEFVVTVKCVNGVQMDSLFEELRGRGFSVKAARY